MGGSTVRRTSDLVSTQGTGAETRGLRADDPPDIVIHRRPDIGPAIPALPGEERRRPSSRVVVADFHSVTRQGMRAMLATCENVTVVAEASTLTEASGAVVELGADLAVLGFELDDAAAVQLLRRIRHDAPFTRLLVLSAGVSEGDVVRALRAGAAAVVSKSAAPREFRAAIEAIRAGGTYLDSSAGAAIRGVLERAGGPPRRASARLGDLTDREMEIARLVAEGLTARRIAKQLGISDRTVNSHIGNLYRRLAVNNRVDAVRELMRLGIAPAPR